MFGAGAPVLAYGPLMLRIVALGVVIGACGGGQARPQPVEQAQPASSCEVLRPDGSLQLRLDLSFTPYLPCGERGQSDGVLWLVRKADRTVTGGMNGCVTATLDTREATFTAHDATLAASAGGTPWNVTLHETAACLWQGTLVIGTDAPRSIFATEIHPPVLD